MRGLSVAEQRYQAVLAVITDGDTVTEVAARQQRIALARLLAALRLPAGAEGDHHASARPQRRVGVRGVTSR
jgi:hypothetical protein